MYVWPVYHLVQLFICKSNARLFSVYERLEKSCRYIDSGMDCKNAFSQMCRSWSGEATVFVGVCVQRSSAVNSKAESGVPGLSFAATDPEENLEKIQQ